MDLRRLLIVRDTVHSEGGLPALRPVTRVAACAVIANPLAGGAHDDLSELILLIQVLGLSHPVASGNSRNALMTSSSLALVISSADIGEPIHLGPEKSAPRFRSPNLRC